VDILGKETIERVEEGRAVAIEGLGNLLAMRLVPETRNGFAQADTGDKECYLLVGKSLFGRPLVVKGGSSVDG
jgi:hypothetical protein